MSSTEMLARIQEVKRRREAELLRKANVVAVGIGYRQRGGHFTDELCLVVSVRRKVPPEMLAPEDCIPPEIDGVPVDVQEVGTLRAL
ncbi:hypothetical protein [Thermoflexus sp.]|uniref:hypothetical protein n=1 Tax=Thermoflexus sp. TaxID=1969742 RepID=UPI0025F906B6|nr:hypothetical protein [Thermoflexus sp.]MCS6965053.1 hypothetical protein [Thermoflexus sp.]MCX7689223.1 hypothetical protein [Thermoflexus sp.]MDW8183760.1 hypothetical protein [Anaerolineae bacterium]